MTAPAQALDFIEDDKNKEETSTENNISNEIIIGENSNIEEFSNVSILSEEIAKQAQETVEDKPLLINLSAEPAIYKAGRPVIIKWDLRNLASKNLNNSGIEIIARPPDGVLPQNKKDVPETDGSLKIESNATQGTVVWEVLEYAQLPLIFNFEVQKDGEMIATNTIIIDEPLSTTSKGRLSNVNSPDNKVRLTLPASASKNPLMVDIRYPSPNALPGASLSWNPVEIIAVDDTTQKNVTQFTSPLTIQIQYDEENIFGADEKSLSIYYYDPELADWFPIETSVDVEKNTLTAQSDHLTVFDYKANNWQSYMVPTVDSFRTSDFTGAGTYQINLWTPPAPGGLQPSVVLSYNSQVVDESLVFTQPSWVGMGWDLDMGAVTRTLHGTDSDWSDDTMSISAGGISGQLLAISKTGDITQYNTADQAFMKVEGNDAAYSFTAWAKDGTKYEFTESTDNNYNLACVVAPQTNNHTWRWNLKKVTDVQGNTMNYTYYTEFKPGCANEIAVYPATITYGNGKYSIEFVREARTDYQTSWTTPASRTLYGTSRLKEVLIKHNGVIVKRYAFAYAPNNATNIYPNFNFSAGGKTLTLVGLQEFDGSGNALPAVTFTYGDAMHLTQVNNGQGGIVAMNYQVWSYRDDINLDLRAFKTVFQTTPNPYGCSGVPSGVMPSGWTYGGGIASCDGTGYLRLGKSSEIGVVRLTIPEALLKPSNEYRFAVNARRITAGCLTTAQALQYGFSGGALATAIVCDTTTTDQVAYLTSSAGLLSTSQLRLACFGCFIRSFEFSIMPTFYRVASRTVTTQPNNLTSTYTYQYDNASPATNDNSVAVAAAGTNLASLYVKKLREFRGHAMSQVTAPNGLTTATWFWQADGIKGRAYDSLVLERTFFDNLDSLNANWITSGGTHTATMEAQKDFDNSIKSVNGSANWNVSLSRASATLTDGEMAVVHVRLSGASAQGEVGLVNGGSFFGLTLSSSGAIASNGATVLSSSNFIKDEWYGVMLFVDANDQTRIRIWQLDNPNNSGEVTLSSISGTWAFRTRVNNGTIYTDSYFEGFPYSETITKYTKTVQYDTTPSNGIPDILGSNTGIGLLTYKDLAITWTRVDSTESRNYNGDAKFVGTKQDFTYATSYGNILTQIESGNDGSGWAVYRKTEYEYSPNATTYVVSAPARQTLKDASNTLLAETLYFYDNNTAYTSPPTKGNLTTQRVWAGGANYAQTSFTYDAYGNVLTQSVFTEFGTATTSPSNSSKQTTTTLYDTAGYNTYPISVTNELGQQVNTAYNYGLGVPTSMTDANLVTTTATYDGFGRLKTITAPGDSSPTLSVTYWDTRIPFQVDLVQMVSASSTIRLSRFYDGAGRLIQTQTANAVVNPSTGSGQVASLQNVVVDSQYNNLGQLIKQTTPYTTTANSAPTFITQSFTQPSTTTVYDVLGRTSTTTAPNQTQIQYTYFDLSSTVKDPKNNSTTSIMDVWGRTKTVTPPTGPGVTYTYDVLNRLTDADRAGNNTHINYDTLGRKLNMDDPDMGYWQYEYDALGNLIKQTDAKGQVICLYYDDLNRLDGKIYSTNGSCSSPVSFDADFNYDAGTNGIGRRTSMSDVSGSTSWVYDTRGRLSSETKVISDQVLGNQTFITTWGYNSGDLPVLMVYPDGEAIAYTYNSDGTLKKVASNTTSDIYLNDMQYDEAGRVKLMQYGNNIINKTFNYFAWNTADMGGLLSSISATTSTNIQNLAYTYDKNGNVLTILDSLSGPQTQTFTYDSLNRITSANASGGTNGLYAETYAYDSATGNLSMKNGVTYSYNDPAHKHAVTNVSTGNSYVYDTNGNMTQRMVNAQTYDLVYDQENRLVSVTAQGVQVIPTPTPTSLPTSTFTETLTPTQTATATETGLPTNTPTETSTSSPTDTPTETQTPTETFTPDPLETPTDTATPSQTPTATQTPTDTLTPTQTDLPTDTPTATLTPTETLTPSVTPTFTFTPSMTLTPSATALPSVTFAQANFTYDGDGKRVKSVMQTNYTSTTTFFVGNYYEVTNEVITKYYYAGSQRIAMRKNGTLSYLFGDHLGSTSLVTDSNGNLINQTKYKAWGEERYSSGTNPSEYTYTGQYSYTSDFGLMFYNARFYDSSLSRFVQADSIIPTGIQGLDRYAYVSNSPTNYIDPSGNVPVDCYGTNYCGSNFASVTLNSGEAPGLTSSSNPGFNDLYSGEELYQVYQSMEGCKDCWWNTNGEFTIETFIGFIIMAEGNGNEQAYKALQQIYAQRLYVGGGSGETDPYCPAGNCFNGVFNYLAATSASARFLIQSYLRDEVDIHRYMGPQSIGQYSLQGSTQEVEQAISTANNLGSYTLQPAVLYGFNVGPSEYGNISMGGAISTISVNVRNSSTYVPENNINGLSVNSVYLYINSAFYYSINQQNYWLGQ